MNKKKWDLDVIIISLILLLLCGLTYYRVSNYYDHFLEGTKLQAPRFHEK